MQLKLYFPIPAVIAVSDFLNPKEIYPSVFEPVRLNVQKPYFPIFLLVQMPDHKPTGISVAWKQVHFLPHS